MLGPTEHTVHENELSNRPTDRLFGDALAVVQQSHGRCETRLGMAAQPSLHHRRAKSSLKRHQRVEAIASARDERLAMRFAGKAQRAVEGDIERWRR